MANKYIVCRQCFGKDGKNPQVLGVIDDSGVLHIKRFHQGSTAIRGSDIIVTCNKCNSSVVLQIRKPPPITLNILGTMIFSGSEITYHFK